MGYFFFDESVHDRGNFVLGAFVYRVPNPQESIAAALTAAGLVPGRDEFKSGARMKDDPRQQAARAGLKAILWDGSKIALVVIPASSRSQLGGEALRALSSFLDVNMLGQQNHQVYLDGGLFPSVTAARAQAISACLPSTCDLYPEADSKVVLGLQLADLVAHSASVMLLERMGAIGKTVKAGRNSGYDPDTEIRIGFELWAGLRHDFFGGPIPDPETLASQADFQYQVEPYGLYVSPLCSALLAGAARACFVTCMSDAYTDRLRTSDTPNTAYLDSSCQGKLSR
jgi:hypothetical protein